MHSNKIRPFVKRILAEQKDSAAFPLESIPDFEVHKTQDHSDHPTKPSAFRVDIKGFMQDPSAYDVSTQNLRDSLNNRIGDAVFCITKPF
jgi:hypothetical protein